MNWDYPISSVRELMMPYEEWLMVGFFTLVLIFMVVGTILMRPGTFRRKQPLVRQLDRSPKYIQKKALEQEVLDASSEVQSIVLETLIYCGSSWPMLVKWAKAELIRRGRYKEES